MNYSNSILRLSKVTRRNDGLRVGESEPTKQAPSRPRKPKSLLRRAARNLAAAALLAVGTTASGQFIISESTGLFAPSFRSTTTLDGGNTTWFGWQGNLDTDPFDNNGFDGATNNELIDNPAVLLGLGGRDGTLNQVGMADILATSNNIFAGDFVNGSFEARLTLAIPTNGTIGIGFTTLILQGNGAFTGEGTSLFPVPGSINGISPQYVTGVNSAGFLQWWAKYNLPGNLDSYSVDILLPGGPGINPASVRQFVADTQWSSTGYANDFALAPEPGSAALLLTCTAFLMGRRHRVALNSPVIS